MIDSIKNCRSINNISCKHESIAFSISNKANWLNFLFNLFADICPFGFISDDNGVFTLKKFCQLILL